MNRQDWLIIKSTLHTLKNDQGCCDCGRKDCPLEFDHDGTEDIKLFSISHGDLYTAQEVWDEVAKCKVRCRSCHRRRTHLGHKHGHYPKSGPDYETKAQRGLPTLPTTGRTASPKQLTFDASLVLLDTDELDKHYARDRWNSDTIIPTGKIKGVTE